MEGMRLGRCRRVFQQLPLVGWAVGSSHTVTLQRGQTVGRLIRTSGVSKERQPATAYLQRRGLEQIGARKIQWRRNLLERRITRSESWSRAHRLSQLSLQISISSFSFGTWCIWLCNSSLPTISHELSTQHPFGMVQHQLVDAALRSLGYGIPPDRFDLCGPESLPQAPSSIHRLYLPESV